MAAKRKSRGSPKRKRNSPYKRPRRSSIESVKQPEVELSVIKKHAVLLETGNFSWGSESTAKKKPRIIDSDSRKAMAVCQWLMEPPHGAPS